MNAKTEDLHTYRCSELRCLWTFPHGGVLDYIYGFWWKCRDCGKWMGIVP